MEYAKGYIIGDNDPCNPIPYYDRAPEYENMVWDRDVMIPMRDGVHLCADIYRPDAGSRFPALFAMAMHNKDLQTPDATENSSSQPPWSSIWAGSQEAGDSRFFTARGYVHIVVQQRGSGKSEAKPEAGVDTWDLGKWDFYDVTEWIAEQSWCDGNVGMIGISAFGGNQFKAAALNPPHLKAIFPFDPMGAYGRSIRPFRDKYPGGMIHMISLILDAHGLLHKTQGRPGILPDEAEEKWQEAMKNPVFRQYLSMYSILTQKGQMNRDWFNLLLNPYDSYEEIMLGEEKMRQIKIPFYTGSGWYAYTYKSHIQGAQHYFMGIKSKNKKMVLTGPGHMERPWIQLQNEVLRWYDYWLKGIDNGIMDESPVKYWSMGENKWRTGEDWPLPETIWIKLYLNSWERLRERPYKESSRDGLVDEYDSFVQMPLTHTRKVSKLRYMTDPLPKDILIAGPIVLKFYASIDQDDTSWIAVLKDVGPDVSVRTAREGEYEVPENLPEREISRGWLWASLRELDPERSKEWKPWHYMTKEKVKKVVPGEINEYQIEIIAAANMFKAGHRICIEISNMDVPTGVSEFTNVEYNTHHICTSKTTLHNIYRSRKYPSHLLLPVIPAEEKD